MGGLMSEQHYYYLRDDANRPLVTVCLSTDINGRHYRGVAICSPKDNPVKRVGRQIAQGRVFRAMHRNQAGDPVYRDEAYQVLQDVKGRLYPYYTKSSPDPVLTPIEIKLLKNRKEK